MWIIDGIAKASKWKLLQSGLYFEEYIKNGKKKFRLIPKMYFSQLLVWLIVTVIVKLLMLAALKITEQFLENFGNFVLKPFSNGKVRLVMVMIFFPVILNGLYFWICDTILKFKPEEEDKDMEQFYNEENNKTEQNKNNKSIEERGNLTHNIQKTNNNHSDIDINNNAKPFNSLELPNISPSII